MALVNSSEIQFILASASPRRRELLGKLGVSFEVYPADVEEVHDPGMSAIQLCLINAEAKARHVGGNHPDALVLGADTLVYRGGDVFGKPGSLEEAFDMLRQLQGQAHEVCTGLCLYQHRSGRVESFYDVTRVYFKTLDAKQIRRYLDKIAPMDKAGAYAIQDHGEWIVDRIEGSFDNVVGLPTERLRDNLETFGVSFSMGCEE